MFRRRDNTLAADKAVAILYPWAFVLLAFGDTFHLGFRLLGFARGDLDFSTPALGKSLGLVGVGAFATALTMTVFYVLMLMIWKRRYQKDYDLAGIVIIIAFVVRFIVMLFPANEWNNAVPPQPWGFYRNLPLMVVGWGIVWLMLRDSAPMKDRPVRLTGLMIVISFLCYTPVILWVDKIPALGMLMIPKTIAYVAIAFIGNHFFFRKNAA